MNGRVRALLLELEKSETGLVARWCKAEDYDGLPCHFTMRAAAKRSLVWALHSYICDDYSTKSSGNYTGLQLSDKPFHSETYPIHRSNPKLILLLSCSTGRIYRFTLWHSVVELC